ncbi:MAG: hypothetical protein AABZ60_01835, partial [Planctomycetota bacterium]
MVWNQNEKTEGYTNFLWVLLIGLAFTCGLDPVFASYGIGLFCFCWTLFFNYQILMDWFQERKWALWGTLFLGSNYTFSCYATGGLETSLQMALQMILCWLYFRLRVSFSYRYLVLCSCVMTLSLWNRLDTGLFLILLIAGLQKQLQSGSTNHRIRNHLSLFLPITLFVGTWLTWKFFYYGNLLPNTFYIKFSSAVAQGAYSLYLFFFSYGLFPFLLLGLFSISLWKTDFRMRFIFAFMILWMLYLIYIGGDFMEFRMMLPLLPPLFWMTLWNVRQPSFSRPILQTIFVGILLGSLHHQLTFETHLRREGIDSISQLNSYVNEDQLNWTQIGKMLAYYFPDRDIRLATSAVGAIPYYSRLDTVDILGLNDPWIAHYGDIWGNRPGHQKHATLEYLKQREVHLLLGNPWIKPHDRVIRYSLKTL